MALGKLLDHMKEKSLFDSTLIIFTGDHGESLISLIISHPEAVPGRVEHYVCHIDIFPTVCAVLVVKKPTFLQGLSLLPALKGKKLPDRPIYFESLYPYYSRGFVDNVVWRYLDCGVEEAGSARVPCFSESHSLRNHLNSCQK